jgi:phospholipase A1/A2
MPRVSRIVSALCWVLFTALTTALLGAAPVLAQTGAPGGASAVCAAIADGTQRLACYDRAAGRADPGASGPVGMPGPGAAPAAPAAAVPAAPASAGAAPGAPGSMPAGPGAAGTEALLDPIAKIERDERRSSGTTLGERWELDAATKQGRFVLRPYKPIYALAARGTDRVNDQPASDGAGNAVSDALGLRAIEAKFQFSFKTKLWETVGGSNVDVWAAYSQTSHWQLYTADLSRPFRETNYEPEIFAIWGTDTTVLGWRTRMLGLGINHQSNGRAEPLSRSWNRVIAQVGFERDDWTVLVRPWWRLQESADVDDNPGIENYIGRGEVVINRKSGGHLWTAQLRHSLRGGDASRGSVLLDWAFPVSSYLKGHLQLFSGYGESLIDFNHRQTTIGLGVSLMQWL